MKRYIPIFSAAAPGLIAIAFIIGALMMPTHGKFYQAPGFFPFIVGSCMLLFSILLTLQEWEKVRSVSQGGEQEPEAPKGKGWWFRTLYIIGAMLFLVILTWFRVSFMLSSAAFLAMTLFVYARKHIWSNLFMIAIVSVGLYYIFTRIFYIPLP